MLEVKVSDLLDKANLAYDQKDWRTLTETCEALLASNIEIAHTYYLLGMSYLSMNCHAIARGFFREVDRLKPNHATVLNNLATCEHELNNRAEAIKLFKRSIQIGKETKDPQVGLYYSNLGGAYTGFGDPVPGEEYLRKSLELGGDHWTVRNNLAVVLLEQGKYKEGWSYYDDRLGNTNVFEPKIYGGKDLPTWNGETHKTVVIFGEQGLGDEIMFASVLRKAVKDMRDKKCEVIFDCNSRLTDIFRSSFPDLMIFGTKNYADQSSRTWPEWVRPEMKIAIGSLCKFYAKDETEFDKTPYIKVNEMIKIEGERPKIGFSWYGGVAHTNIYHRYIKLEMWKEIFKLPCDFISLQYNADADIEIDNFKKKYGIENVYHNADIMADFDKTAALVNGLDLIISAPQTVVHLAAAMGKPVWQLTPLKAMWQMNIVDKWYGSAQEIRQTQPDKWEHVMAKVKDKLEREYVDIGKL